MGAWANSENDDQTALDIIVLERSPLENGHRFLELCMQNNLFITYSFLQGKPCHTVSWHYPCSGYWHQPDLLTSRRKVLVCVACTQTCDTGTRSSKAKVKLLLRRVHTSKQKGQTHINISNNMGEHQHFSELLARALPTQDPSRNVSELWKSLKMIICEAASLAFK